MICTSHASNVGSSVRYKLLAWKFELLSLSFLFHFYPLASVFGMQSIRRTEAGPSSIKSTSSHLDPLPASHPLSIKLRTVFDSTSSPSCFSEENQKALVEIEQRYAKTRPKAISRKNSQIGYIPVDTEKARNSLSRDAQDSLEESCLIFLNSLQVVDEVRALVEWFGIRSLSSPPCSLSGS